MDAVGEATRAERRAAARGVPALDRVQRGRPISPALLCDASTAGISPKEEGRTFESPRPSWRPPAQRRVALNPRAIRRVPPRVRRGLPNERRRGGQTGGRKGRVPRPPPPSPLTSGSATGRGASLQSWGGSGRFDARQSAMTEGGGSDGFRPICPPLSGPRRLGPVSCRKARGSACVRRLSGLSGLVPWAPA